MIKVESAVEKWEEVAANAFQASIGRWYKRKDIQVLVCVAHEPDGWHMSISAYEDGTPRNPTWEEIFGAWYDLVPGAGKDFDGVLILPRQSEYVNIHKHCFHVYQSLESGERRHKPVS